MTTKPALGEADYARAAAALSVPVAAIKAVCEIEAPNGGFLPSGEPTILFERHKFSKYTGGKWDQAHPDISNPERGGYGPTGVQHRRLQRAAALDRTAALRATSWGRFQILGDNFRQAGFRTLQAFVTAMYRSEADQLNAFVAFVSHSPKMVRALQRQDWASFARTYNGPAYAENRYDTRLAQAFERHSNAA